MKGAADVSRDASGLAFGVLGVIGWQQGVVVFKAGNNVEVGVEDLLPCRFAIVHDEVDTGAAKRELLRTGNILGEQREVHKQVGVELEQVRVGFFRDHKHVPLLGRIDIEESHGCFVLVNYVSRDLAPDDLHENRVHTLAWYHSRYAMRPYELRPPANDLDLSDLPPRLTLLLLGREFVSRAAVDRFLAPNYDEHLNYPEQLHDMPAAVERIARAIEAGEHIAIFADYDCDGIPGAVVLHDCFRALRVGSFETYIPHRHLEGFGLSVAAVEKLAVRGVTLIVTIDCGIGDATAVARAGELGIDVIITDHHEPGSELPDAVAVVNPKLGDYPDPNLCGAAVAFKLAQALLTVVPHELPAGGEKWWLDMVGLATIADMVPLVGENRVFARYGLLVLRKSRRPGLQQLLRKARAEQAHLTEDDIGFTIGPRINAASRMDAPEAAFQLLATSDEAEAATRVIELEGLNNERKGQVAAMTRELHSRIDELTAKGELPPVLVFGAPHFRPALAGLAANKLAEEHARPVFIWGRDGQEAYKGSCRAGGGVSVVALMQEAADVFVEYGGHHASGGFTVAPAHIHTFADALVAAYEKLGAEAVLLGTPEVDAELSLSEVNHELVRTLAALAPFGAGNPKPLFAFADVTPVRVEQFGKGREHCKLVFETDGGALEAIAFFASPETFSRSPAVGEPTTLLAHVEESRFGGRSQVRLRIVNIL